MKKIPDPGKFSVSPLYKRASVKLMHMGISPHQLSYVTHSNSGEGLLFFGNVTIPFVDRFPKNTKLYSIMTTRPEDRKAEAGKE